MTRSAQPTRQRILDTATELFSREGYNAVGIDTIIERSGVAKMTLYRHFPSKNDLIIAFLECEAAKNWEWLKQVIHESTVAPREQLIAIFQALASKIAQPTCYGCSSLHAAVEFPLLDHPIHQVALESKEVLRAYFRELGAQAEARQPDMLADQLLLLMDGTLMQARMRGPIDLHQAIVQAAIAMIDAQLNTHVDRAEK